MFLPTLSMRHTSVFGGASHLSIGAGCSRAEWVGGVKGWHLLFRRLLHLSLPGPLAAMRRHKHPLALQRVIPDVLVLCGTDTACS